MEQWVSLEAPSAYGVSVHSSGVLAAACADGLVRLFRAADLQYIATLPRPPPLGRANINSLRELQEITDATAAAESDTAAAVAESNAAGFPVGGPEVAGGSEAAEYESVENAAELAAGKGPGLGLGGAKAGAGGRESEVGMGAEAEARAGIGEGERVAAERDGSTEGVSGFEAGEGVGAGAGVGLRYPAALGCRLNPTGTKAVVVYGDRGLFVWDVADPQRIGKYRSFLAHGACIWDVQRMPGK